MFHRRGASRCWSVACALVLVGLVGPVQIASSDAGPEPAASPLEQDVAAVLDQIKELFAARESKQLVTPIPGSRSSILAADATAVFLYLEQGSIRGDAIDTFYEQYNAGDMQAAYRTFTQNNVATLRASDYGWNGLGAPLTTASGSEINDVYYRVVDGIFRQSEISSEDTGRYLELLRDVVLPALQGS